VDVKGGAPGTRETDAIRPGTSVAECHAVVLAGGSAFGLEAATGVVRWLEERGVGFDTRVARVPIVPGAVLFDLGIGDPLARPDASAGYAACEDAIEGPIALGSVGAGTGAVFAKLPDPSAGWKGGVGEAGHRDGEAIVWALAAVNALGTVLDEDGAPLVENRNPTADPLLWPEVNTTLVVVATNATLSKERAQLLAQAGSEGLSLVVSPAHTMWDGDVVFALATGLVDVPQPRLESLATRAASDAIRSAVRAAQPLGGIPALGAPGEGTG
jgi:L-aminopeptidase/D-esterase-like protein